MYPIEADTIYLRALEPEDLEWLYQIENDNEPWSAAGPHTPTSRYAIKQYIAQQPQNIYQCQELRLAICLKKDNTPIGVIDLTDYQPHHGRAEIGITILFSHRKKGYGSQALHLLTDYAEKNLHLHQLYAYVIASHNPAAGSLFLSAGYTPIAKLPQWHFAKGEYAEATIFQKIFQKNL
ncbi:MAG: GNAT family N-acetyltransferase [Bacteroidaceae bacterium]|nr:GNAT family N-acetyltransferase [Bacteroidaceae bacterium]